MTIRFLPFWLGSAIGTLLLPFCVALANGDEQNIRWSYEVFKACCIGFISASLYVVVTAAFETKRRGFAKVRLW